MTIRFNHNKYVQYPRTWRALNGALNSSYRPLVRRKSISADAIYLMRPSRAWCRKWAHRNDTRGSATLDIVSRGTLLNWSVDFGATLRAEGAAARATVAKLRVLGPLL